MGTSIHAHTRKNANCIGVPDIDRFVLLSTIVSLLHLAGVEFPV
jgi:hypothetical protein